MTAEQKMFYDFLMERARDDKKDEAKALLDESFARLDAGTLDQAYLQGILPQVLGLVKPEAMDELKVAMESFSAQVK